jgi:anticodon-binding protein
VAPSLFEVMVVLGRERVITRLRRAADHLRASARQTSSQNA